MAKNVAKSVRLSEEVFALVDSRPEEGFNNKFEGMVLEFYSGAAKREVEVARLDKLIAERKKALQETIAACNQWYRVDEQLRDVVTNIKRLETVSQRIGGSV